MTAPLDRARALVAGMADKTEFLTEDNIQRTCAIAAAGLALRDRCHHGDGGPGPDCECPMCAFDAAVAKAMAESERE